MTWEPGAVRLMTWDELLARSRKRSAWAELVREAAESGMTSPAMLWWDEMKRDPEDAVKEAAREIWEAAGGDGRP